MLKRKRKTTDRPSSGRHISKEQYDKLFESYMQYENIKRAAEDADVTIDTATKYIAKGTSRFPAIRERIQNIHSRALQEQDTQVVEHVRVFKQTAVRLVEEQVAVLSNVRFMPKGKHAVDAAGNELKINGRPVIEVDETTFGKIVVNLRECINLYESLAQKETGQGTKTGGIHIGTMNVGLGKEAIMEEAKSVLLMQSRLLGKDGEVLARSALSGEALRRTEAIDVLAYAQDEDEEV